MALVFERQQQPSYDARVAFFQLLLGLPSAAVDGLFGADTEARVMEFQRQAGVPADGRVDEQTGRKLNLPYWDAQIARTDLSPPFRDPEKFAEGHQFVFRSEIPEGGGHFSSKPERFVPGTLNKGTVRALRTNNPGALNISRWQKSMPGYTGETLNDGHGNRTTIYETPEKGVGAWHELVVVIYSRKPGYIQHGTFSLERLARAYAGVPLDAPDGDPAVEGYLAGWRKWSDRIPDSHLETNEIDPTNTDQLRRLAIAMFSHESSFATPLIASQVAQGIEQAQWRIAKTQGGERGPRLVRPLSLDQLLSAQISVGALTLEMALEEDRADAEQRRKRMLEILQWEAQGIDVNDAAENEEAAPVQSRLIKSRTMDEPYDSIPRTFEKRTAPPSKKALAAMAARDAEARAPTEPGPYPEVNTQLTDGPGVYCYKDEDARYGLAETIDALRELADILSRRYAGRRYGVGDISLLGGGDISGHVSHEKGVDIDVRPLRDDWAEEGVLWTDSVYSRERTQEVIDLFWANSHLAVDRIFFNDEATQGTQPWPNHDNHFHVRFRHPGQGKAPPELARGNGLAAANNELQRCLNLWKNATNHPGLDLVVDGHFGQQTYDRVREFQTALGLGVDGIVKSSTWERLQQWRA